MPSKLTYHDKITLALNSERGKWLYGYQLEKVDTPFGWIGSSGSRRARELAEQGYHIVKGVKYDIERRDKGKYVQYRVTNGKKKVIRFVEVEKNGEIMMRKIEEIVEA